MTQSQLLMHTASGEYCTLDELRNIPLPEETPTYKPVSHFDLATNLAEVSGTLLRDYVLDRSQYGLARDGAQLFGIHTYRMVRTVWGSPLASGTAMTKACLWALQSVLRYSYAITLPLLEKSPSPVSIPATFGRTWKN